MFDISDTAILGCYEIKPTLFDDERGRFVKTFHRDVFSSLNLETNFSEEYYSHSKRGVIRGMHFQTPPADHVKMVYCTYGEVIDVVLDLRRGSPSYGKYATFTLSAKAGNIIYIPRGLAHGFLVASESATLVYKVTTVYDQKHDNGVLWDSFGYSWPIEKPVISERDSKFINFSDFESPFYYE